MSIMERITFTETPIHAGADPKFSAAASFGAPIEFCWQRRCHKKTRRRDRRGADLYRGSDSRM